MYRVVVILALIFGDLVCLQTIERDAEIISNRPVTDDTLLLGRTYYIGDFYSPNAQVQMNVVSWRASANVISDNPDGPKGQILFRQYSPALAIVVNINVTGLPTGKHAVHVHTFGDLTEGCKSTGSHFKQVLIGNIDVKEGGAIDITFQNPYIAMFGPRGIVGRSIAIHEKPIEVNRFPDIYALAPTSNPVAYESEEQAVGGILACGIITITSNGDDQ